MTTNCQEGGITSIMAYWNPTAISPSTQSTRLPAAIMSPRLSLSARSWKKAFSGTRNSAAEMPAAYHLEALKAQAVAARTFARRQMAGGKPADADVCSQSACCQACLSADALQER